MKKEALVSRIKLLKQEGQDESLILSLQQELFDQYLEPEYESVVGDMIETNFKPVEGLINEFNDKYRVKADAISRLKRTYDVNIPEQRETLHKKVTEIEEEFFDGHECEQKFFPKSQHADIPKNIDEPTLESLREALTRLFEHWRQEALQTFQRQQKKKNQDNQRGSRTTLLGCVVMYDPCLDIDVEEGTIVRNPKAPGGIYKLRLWLGWKMSPRERIAKRYRETLMDKVMPLFMQLDLTKDYPVTGFEDHKKIVLAKFPDAAADIEEWFRVCHMDEKRYQAIIFRDWVDGKRDKEPRPMLADAKPSDLGKEHLTSKGQVKITDPVWAMNDPDAIKTDLGWGDDEPPKTARDARKRKRR